ncbi:MAG: fluoride efflux transporter CrcB [Tannerellaceae bacterium]|jgi:CrcB protein|nr:fluoride efflux transporter CrcB [Tannerellaceae bacterium]
MIKQLLLVCIGGGAGSALRFLISFVTGRCGPAGLFPLATFIVNVTGCILIGLLIGFADRYEVLDRNMKLLLITGFCGGYTTFSTFSLENIQLLEGHHYLTFAVYTSGSLAAGIAAVALGIFLSRL